jgi:hypothetical protein
VSGVIVIKLDPKVFSLQENMYLKVTDEGSTFYRVEDINGASYTVLKEDVILTMHISNAEWDKYKRTKVL